MATIRQEGPHGEPAPAEVAVADVAAEHRPPAG